MKTSDLEKHTNTNSKINANELIVHHIKNREIITEKIKRIKKKSKNESPSSDIWCKR